jgi:hypothetical protein
LSLTTSDSLLEGKAGGGKSQDTYQVHVLFSWSIQSVKARWRMTA